jgi:hypothetical protein
MKLYVIVVNTYDGLFDDVFIYRNKEDMRKQFEEDTGYSVDQYKDYQDDYDYDGDRYYLEEVELR